MYETMDDLVASVQKRLYRMRDLADDMAAVTARESAPDDSITAEVDGNGALLNLEFSQAVSKMTPEQFEQALLAATHGAARRAFTARGELITAFNEEVAE
ncbi:YbaB/EbfC family nucleoid-associated protein [Nocardia sp. NPDC052566]|uniref:YbaB/EbfC family nucleoid-associated protein n=1 Tax=Nocardia sp. NPDC052566 TaxID=3364330 RepID=UPI0037C95DA0